MSVNAAKPINFGGNTVQAASFLGGQFVSQGTHWFVRPDKGSDAHDGRTMQSAFKTLQKALLAATANKNDIVFLVSESNSASATTARVTTAGAAAINWNKDLVHLIGVNNGVHVSQRSRIAFDSDFATAANLFTVSASGCLISDIQFFAGVADANPTGCMLVTGDRNRFVNCHFAGIGHNDNDISGAYSLKLDAADENLFEKCLIGLDTIARGTNANSGLLVDGASARNEFRDCGFTAQLEHATNHVHVRLNDATAIDRYLLFQDCIFRYFSANYTAAGTGVMKLTADLTQGWIEVVDCVAYSDAPATVIKWDVDDRNKIQLFNSPTPAADTAGVSRPA